MPVETAHLFLRHELRDPVMQGGGRPLGEVACYSGFDPGRIDFVVFDVRRHSPAWRTTDVELRSTVCGQARDCRRWRLRHHMIQIAMHRQQEVVTSLAAIAVTHETTQTHPLALARHALLLRERFGL